MPSIPRTLGSTLSKVSSLTPAQHVLLRRIGEHSSPVTVHQLADEAGLHVSSVRETLESLVEAKLVSKEPVPASGRGRPALGYMTYVPSDPAFPAQMLTQVIRAVLTWLEEHEGDAREAARAIGRHWGKIALDMMEVPSHVQHTEAPLGFKLVNHMTKIRLFLTSFGYAPIAHPHSPTAFLLTACPFVDPDAPDPLALEIRHGMVEGILELTASRLADFLVRPYEEDPTICEVLLTDRTTPPTSSPLTLRYFGGAAQAAGTIEEAITTIPQTLRELITDLSARSPELAKVLTVSTFLINNERAHADSQLEGGMRIDVLPPFAGG